MMKEEAEHVAGVLRNLKEYTEKMLEEKAKEGET